METQRVELNDSYQIATETENGKLHQGKLRQGI
jgi:hypothetical protein